MDLRARIGLSVPKPFAYPVTRQFTLPEPLLRRTPRNKAPPSTPLPAWHVSRARSGSTAFLPR